MGRGGILIAGTIPSLSQGQHWPPQVISTGRC